MEEPKDDKKNKKPTLEKQQRPDNTHLGSSNAFAETENPLSDDPDNISDERLDILLDEA
jgi:hypothetical protein